MTKYWVKSMYWTHFSGTRVHAFHQTLKWGKSHCFGILEMKTSYIQGGWWRQRVIKPVAKSHLPGGAHRGLTWGLRGSSAASTGPVSLFNRVSTRWIISRIRFRNPARSEGRMNSLYTWWVSVGRGRGARLIPLVPKWTLLKTNPSPHCFCSSI